MLAALEVEQENARQARYCLEQVKANTEVADANLGRDPALQSFRARDDNKGARLDEDPFGASSNKMENLQQKKTDLETSIEKMTDKVKELTAEMAQTQKEMGRASDNREKENAELEVTISDQRIAQVILKKALARMKQVYLFMQENKPGAAHIATSATKTDAGNAPAKFKEYEQNDGGSRVVQMIEEVIADSQKLEDESMTRSMNSQIEYEDFMQSSNKGLAQMIKTKAGLEEALATAHEDLIATKADIMDTLKVLEGLNALLDHRAEIFIPELNGSFACPTSRWQPCCCALCSYTTFSGSFFRH